MKIYSKECFTKLPDAVLFDTDNTLYSYAPAHHAALLAVKSKIVSTFSFSPEDFDSAYQFARQQVKSRLGNTASSHSRLLYLQRMLEMMGLGSQVLMALDFEQTYWRTFLSNATLFEGVKDLLDDFRRLRIPLAIITDLTAQIQFRKIVYFGLDHYFDYIVTSEEAGADKLGIAPYEIAIEKIRPQGNHIWMIGDDIVGDIKASKEAINSVTLLKSEKLNKHHNNGEADLVFEDYKDIIKLIRSI